MTAPSGTARAIVLMVLAALCFTLNDTITKFLIDQYAIGFIILIRSLIALPLLMVLAIVLGRDRVRWSTAVGLYAVRGGIGLLAAWMYILGLHSLSVAEATVIVFASPFLITLGSAVIFREKVGWRKWAAVLVCFAGVVIAIQPGAETFQPASLLILACAFLYATISLTARFLPREDSLWTMSFFGAAFSALFVLPLTVGDWKPLRFEDLALFFGAALCSSLGIGLGSLAYRSAPASDLAPFAYSGLIWSTLLTWLVWSSIPGVWTLVGAAIIASSSIFHVLSRNAAARHGGNDRASAADR